MSTQQTKFTAIADAIRAKKGTTASIEANNFASEIASISAGGGYETLTINISGIPDGRTPKVTLSYGDNEIYQIYEDSVVFYIAHEVEYIVSFEDIQGYAAPSSQTFTASEESRVLDLSYALPISSIYFDNTLSDPENITGDVNAGQIADILSGTGRCLFKTVDGVNYYTMLDASDSTKYSDGSDAALDGSEGDVMVYIPQFSAKSIADGTNTEVQLSTSAIGGGETFAERLIGAYKTSVTSSIAYSVSGVAPKVSYSHPSFHTAAMAKGSGWSNITMIDHNIIAMLFFAKYGNRDSQAVIGTGGLTHNGGYLTGTTNSIGNTDTTSTPTGLANNFLGIEAVIGWLYEWMDDVIVNNGVWTITNDSGETRTVQSLTSGGFITSMKFEAGGSVDMVPTAIGGSESTYYTDYIVTDARSSHVVARSDYSTVTGGGVGYVNTTYGSSNPSASIGSRLAFHGSLTRLDPTEYKALFE